MQLQRRVEEYPELLPFKFKVEKDEVILTNQKLKEYEDLP